MDNIFVYALTLDTINENYDYEPRSVKEYRRRNDWLKWESFFESELKFFKIWQVFGHIAMIPENIQHVRYN